MSEENPPVGPQIDCEELIKQVQTATAALVRASNEVPLLGDGYELLSTFPQYAQFMATQRGRIMALMRKLFNGAGLRNVRVNESRLEDMEHLIAGTDQLADRIAKALDEHQANLNRDRIKARQIQLGAESIPGGSSIAAIQPAPDSAAAAFNQPFKDGGGRYAILSTTSTSVSVQQQQFEATSSREISTFSAFSSATIVKPQQLYGFHQHIVNTDQPFVHKLRIKHNALEKTTYSNKRGTGIKLVSEFEETQTGRDWLEDSQNGAESVHPYQEEIAHFKPTKKQLAVPDHVQKPKPLEDTPFTYVENEEQLDQLVQELNAVDEFAFDLEHHNQRSYLGLTCLVQISTREKDFVVDPFPLWQHMYKLNEPFTNPNILKVAFDPAGDTIWLQRDFGIYTVGLFDTALAFRKFDSAAGYSLKKMVFEICGVELDKKYKLADWRRRPLTDPMLVYARSDTHYLLPCLDHLKKALAKGREESGENSILHIFKKSKRFSREQFQPPRFDPKGYSKLRTTCHRFNNRQMFALEKMWAWRDEIAREHDESVHYVLPNHMMLKIAEVLPREQSGILACCAPVPPLVRHEIASLSRIIAIARELPLQTANLSSSVGAQQKQADELLADPTLQNRVAGVQAKLDFRFDNGKHGAVGDEYGQHQQQESQEVLGFEKVEPLMLARCRLDIHLLGSDRFGRGERCLGQCTFGPQTKGSGSSKLWPPDAGRWTVPRWIGLEEGTAAVAGVSAQEAVGN